MLGNDDQPRRIEALSLRDMALVDGIPLLARSQDQPYNNNCKVTLSYKLLELYVCPLETPCGWKNPNPVNALGGQNGSFYICTKRQAEVETTTINSP